MFSNNLRSLGNHFNQKLTKTFLTKAPIHNKLDVNLASCQLLFLLQMHRFKHSIRHGLLRSLTRTEKRFQMHAPFLIQLRKRLVSFLVRNLQH